MLNDDVEWEPVEIVPTARPEWKVRMRVDCWNRKRRKKKKKRWRLPLERIA